MANDLRLQVLLSAIDKTTGPLKRISAGSTETARALKSARDRLKELSTQQKDVGAWRTQRAAAEQTGLALNAAREKVKALSQQISAAGTPTKALSNDFKRAVRDARALKQQHQQQSVQLQTLRTRLNTAGISTKNLSSHERNLRSQMAAANAAISSQTDRLKRLGAQQDRLKRAKSRYGKGIQTAAAMGGTGMAARASGMYTGEKLQTMLGVGYNFDAIMSSTQAVTRVADKNSEAMQALRNQARTLPLTSKFTDSEVAQGQYFLGRTGYNPEQILGAMPGMLNLAAAGDMELGDTADIASNIQTAMGIPAEKMGKVADVLTAAFTRNNVDIKMLGDSLKYSAGVGREYGQSLETVTAATALLGNAGVQGSMAGTAMRSVLTRIGTSKAVAKLGVQTKDGSGNMRDMLEILADINEKTKGMGNVERGAVYKDIAGQYAVTSFGTLMRSVETGQFQSMRGSLNNAEGEAGRVAATQLDNLKGDMTMLHAALENISVELFDKNSPWLREMAKDLSHLLHGFGEFLKENPAISKAIVITIGGFSVLIATLGTLTIGLAGILGPMIAVRFLLAQLGIRLPGIIGLLKGFRTVIRTLASTMMGPLIGAIRTAGIALWGLAANPVALAIAAVIVAIAVAALVIYKYWEPIKAFVTGFWQGLMDGIAPVKQALLPAFTALGNALAPLKPLWDGIISVLGTAWGWFSKLFEPIQSTSEELQSATDSGLAFGRGLAGLINLLVKFVGEIFLFGANLVAALVGGIASMGSALKNHVITIWTEINAGFSGGLAGIITTLVNFSPLGLVYQAFAGVLSYLGVELPGRFTEFGGMIVNGLISGLTAGLGSVKNAIGSIGDASIGWFKEKLGIHSPSRVFAELGGFTMAGLTQGLEDGEKGPLKALTQISQKLTDAGGVTLQTPVPITLPESTERARKRINQPTQLALGPIAQTPNPTQPFSDGLLNLMDIGKQIATAGALALGALTLPALAVDDRPPIASAPVPATYDSHDVYHINIPATPGIDAQTIARAVQAALARIESEKKARNRSKLSDLE